MFEVPVQFFSLSPAQVRRTSPLDGVRALAAVLGGRVRRFGRRAPVDAAATADAATTADAAKPSRAAQVR
jgi:hypothetical protein